MNHQLSTIIIVSGLPGTGKTFFATRLAEKLGAVHFNTDKIREELGKMGQYDSATKQLVYDTLKERMVENAQQGNAVVVDATFYRAKLRESFENAARKAGLEPIWMEVTAEEELVRERTEKKRKDSEADFQVYRKLKMAFEPIRVDHLTLVSGRDNIDEMIREALDYLKKEGVL